MTFHSRPGYSLVAFGLVYRIVALASLGCAPERQVGHWPCELGTTPLGGSSGRS